MALRNQPYFPLYVDDYLTDEKLNLCSASTQGVYIKILCVLHKQEEYGKLLLKQKDKHLPEICLNFAYKLARLLPFTEDIIHNALIELLEEKVLYIENDYLCQKRMIKDEIISKKRAVSGSKGGKKTQFALANTLANTLAKSEANSVYVNENEIVNKDINKDNILNIEPSLENIKNYCLENNISLELAAKFYSFYETQDWMVYNKQGRATVDLKQNNRWAKKLNEWNLEELKNGIAKHKSGIAADTLREIAESIANDPDLKD